MHLEEKFVKMELKEENHLANIYNSPLFRGWYLYVLDTEEEGVKHRDVIVRFRVPPTICLYGDVLRNFTDIERIVGIHRLLTGKDLQDETKFLLNLENIEEYIKTLNDEEVKELLGRIKNMVTLDCNRVPYLHLRDVSNETDEIKKFVLRFPDYLRMLYDVLNENLSIAEVTLLSNHVIYNELEEINSIKK